MGSEPHSFGAPALGGIGRKWTTFSFDGTETVGSLPYRRCLDREAMAAGHAMTGYHVLGQLRDDPPGWMTTFTTPFWRTAQILKLDWKDGAGPPANPGVMLRLWVHAAIWWALVDYAGSIHWFGSRNTNSWRGDDRTRRVLKFVKSLKRRESRYMWMAEVGLTHRIGAGGPRDIAAILLKVAMMEGGQ
jgi:hypothetical protein